jgi:hypothetical protein
MTIAQLKILLEAIKREVEAHNPKITIKEFIEAWNRLNPRKIERI